MQSLRFLPVVLVAWVSLGISHALAGPAASEAARVQAFLNARYSATDVKYQFITKAGETIDCIDFFAQPGVKALAARGTPIKRLPPDSPPFKPSGKPSLALVEGLAFDGAPDENGHARLCPHGTVPQIHMTAERIARSGGLDALRGTHRKMGPPISPVAAPTDGAGVGYAHAQVSYTGGGSLAGGASTLQVWSVNVPNDRSHSLSQTWTTSGGNYYNGCYTTACQASYLQTVEVGSINSPALNGGNNGPYLFIYSTSDGYETGCYNDSEETGYCQPWIGNPQAPYAPGMALTSSVMGNTAASNEFTALTLNNTDAQGNQGWFVVINGATIGYYPSTYFFRAMQQSAVTFSAGGEVLDVSGGNGVAMGSGADPRQGYGFAAAQHDYYALVTSSKGANVPSYNFSSPGATVPASFPSYPANGTPSPIDSPYAKNSSPVAWSNGFYFGDALTLTPPCGPNGVAYSGQCVFPGTSCGTNQVVSYVGQCVATGQICGSNSVYGTNGRCVGVGLECGANSIWDDLGACIPVGTSCGKNLVYPANGYCTAVGTFCGNVAYENQVINSGGQCVGLGSSCGTSGGFVGLNGQCDAGCAVGQVLAQDGPSQVGGSCVVIGTGCAFNGDASGIWNASGQCTMACTGVGCSVLKCAPNEQQAGNSYDGEYCVPAPSSACTGPLQYPVANTVAGEYLTASGDIYCVTPAALTACNHYVTEIVNLPANQNLGDIIVHCGQIPACLPTATVTGVSVSGSLLSTTPQVVQPGQSAVALTVTGNGYAAANSTFEVTVTSPSGKTYASCSGPVNAGGSSASSFEWQSSCNVDISSSAVSGNYTVSGSLKNISPPAVDATSLFVCAAGTPEGQCVCQARKGLWTSGGSCIIPGSSGAGGSGGGGGRSGPKIQ